MQKRKYKVGDIVLDLNYGRDNKYRILKIDNDTYTIENTVNVRPFKIHKEIVEEFENGTVPEEIFTSPLFKVMKELKSSTE